MIPSPAQEVSVEPQWKVWLLGFAYTLIAFVFILAGYSKIYEYSLWLSDIASHRFLGQTAPLVAVLLPAAEIALGHAILFSPRRHTYAWLSVGILGAFCLYQILRAWQGAAWGFPSEATCKCLKLPSSVEITPALRNAGLILVAIIWARLRPRATDAV